jgi:hypothetical protein
MLFTQESLDSNSQRTAVSLRVMFTKYQYHLQTINVVPINRCHNSNNYMSCLTILLEMSFDCYVNAMSTFNFFLSLCLLLVVLNWIFFFLLYLINYIYHGWTLYPAMIFTIFQCLDTKSFLIEAYKWLYV